MATIHLTDAEAFWLYEAADHCSYDIPLEEGEGLDIPALIEKLHRAAVEHKGNPRCASCGKEIIAPRSGQRTCSDACRQRLSRLTRARMQTARQKAARA